MSIQPEAPGVRDILEAGHPRCFRCPGSQTEPPRGLPQITQHKTRRLLCPFLDPLRGGLKLLGMNRNQSWLLLLLSPPSHPSCFFILNEHHLNSKASVQLGQQIVLSPLSLGPLAPGTWLLLGNQDIGEAPGISEDSSRRCRRRMPTTHTLSHTHSRSHALSRALPTLRSPHTPHWHPVPLTDCFSRPNILGCSANLLLLFPLPRSPSERGLF